MAGERSTTSTSCKQLWRCSVEFGSTMRCPSSTSVLPSKLALGKFEHSHFYNCFSTYACVNRKLKKCKKMGKNISDVIFAS